METFFIIGFGILISFIIIGIVQYIGNDLGNIFFDGFYGNTSIGDKLREKNKKLKFNQINKRNIKRNKQNSKPRLNIEYCQHCNDELNDLNWWKSWKINHTTICIPCGRKINKEWDTKDKAKDRIAWQSLFLFHPCYR